MPIVDELDLPIRHVAIAGPAIDVLETRKESSSNPRIEALELRESFNNIKETLFIGIKALEKTISHAPALQRSQRGDD